MVAHLVLERHAHTAEGLSGPELDHCLDLHGRASPSPAVRPDDAQRAANRPRGQDGDAHVVRVLDELVLLGRRVVVAVALVASVDETADALGAAKRERAVGGDGDRE